MNELKPCPFCGGEAEMGVNKESTVREYFVGCMNCHIRLYKIGYKRFYTEAEAVAAWNTRAERTCKVESCTAFSYDYSPEVYYEFKMKCGGSFDWNYEEPPSHCPECGGRVVEL